MFSDDEGSDFGKESSQSDDAEDQDYDPVNDTVATFDKKKGDDKWIGRRVVKTFGSAGDFEGIVYGVDADENKKGYRLFLIHYFDDDDGESMWPEELHR